MFAGHIGTALAIGRAERGVNVGVFITAALLLDLLLWLFVLFGWESVAIPASFASTHQPEYVFPHSHGLLASVVWCVLAGGVAFVSYSDLRTRWRAAALVAIAVLSHWAPEGGAPSGHSVPLLTAMPLISKWAPRNSVPEPTNARAGKSLLK